MTLLRFVPLLVSILFATRAVAQPIPAATPEGILCAGTYVMAGRVLDAASGPDDVVDLRVEVTDVMGAREASPSYPVGRTLRRGDVIAVRTPAFASLVVTTMPPPRPALSDRQIRDAFVDHEFIFSVTMMDRHVAHDSAFPANLWPLSEKAWALDTMASDPDANCPQRR